METTNTNKSAIIFKMTITTGNACN
jgi:hypothetical protein